MVRREVDRACVPILLQYSVAEPIDYKMPLLTNHSSQEQVACISAMETSARDTFLKC
jgi:hypothetical protein